MNQLIPEATINLIKEHNDIADIVSEYVQLKKQGRNYFGLCPFHGENTPSFSVAPDKQIFHCFGCGAGGNVFTFLMDIEGLSFVEAARKLADRVNISLNIQADDEVEKKTPRHNDMLEAHELLKKLYHHMLLNTEVGQKPLEYLLNRGFTMEAIEKFHIGYAVDSWEFTTDFLKKRSFESARMEEAGLLVKTESGTFGDRFRHRIMFPITDHQGRTIAFSGRALGEREPKYLNSPETVIFHKSKTLYNFQQARPAIRKLNSVVLFEGFLDVISADAAGVHNGIATMGTAMTKEHLQILKRITDQIVICYDADKAGMAAAKKTADVILHEGLQVKVCVMPDGYDPDEYIKAFGKEKFQKEVITGALSLIAFKMLFHRRGKNLANESEKVVYIETMLDEIAKVHKDYEREIYLKQLAEEFDLSVSALSRQANKVVKRMRNRDGPMIQPINASAEIFIKDRKLKPAYQIAEENLLFYMLKSRYYFDKIERMLADQTFNRSEHQQIFTELRAYFGAGHSEDVSLFLNVLSDRTLRKIVTEIEMKSLQKEPTDKELDDYIHKIKLQNYFDILKQKEFEMRESEKLHDTATAMKIAMDIVQIKKTIENSTRRE